MITIKEKNRRSRGEEGRGGDGDENQCVVARSPDFSVFFFLFPFFLGGSFFIFLFPCFFLFEEAECLQVARNGEDCKEEGGKKVRNRGDKKEQEGSRRIREKQQGIKAVYVRLQDVSLTLHRIRKNLSGIWNVTLNYRFSICTLEIFVLRIDIIRHS